MNLFVASLAFMYIIKKYTLVHTNFKTSLTLVAKMSCINIYT